MTLNRTLPAGRRRGTLRAVAAAVAVLGAGAALTTTATPARADYTGPHPGTFTGQGFDTCTAPSNAAMKAWLASPYRAVGIYIGGNGRACAQPNLTREWVSTQAAAGWRFFPLYVGPQAPCRSTSKPRIDPAQAAAQGRAAADDAAARARDLGLPRESTVFYNMEKYPGGDAACSAAVQTFTHAWTIRLHDHGYFSGFYTDVASGGLADQVSGYERAGHGRPDYLDFARWDGVQAVTDEALPESYWMPKQRMKQYRGDHHETWGGVTINIDSNLLDLAVLPATPFGDFTGNGWADLGYRDPATGQLHVYGGNGATLSGRSSLGAGWNGMDAIVRAGNFDRSGGEDLLAREMSTGYLWFYPGNGSGVTTRVRVGSGWNSMREITPVGDWNGDGYQDLAAVQTSTGALWLYPGRGTGFGSRIALDGGVGWNEMDELSGGADFTGDGRPDLLAREKSTGRLRVHPGGPDGLVGVPIDAGAGWGGMRDLVQLGDFDRDGQPDLAAVQQSTGNVLRYRWNGGGWLSPTRLGSGFGAMQPLL
ncbi:glycoside hydrolase domain-containing protein [Micromonospora sp. CPCC 205546]|uniref:glycoside hydrolase domain-containing protein n=1 Tax=Micromonospora sp. CPCC 205546 TaxID=3122397 RepID=UPI002FF25DB8